jgi:RimJ/RimL family protein N-acetyltransferase
MIELRAIDPREAAMGHAYRFAIVDRDSGETAGEIELRHAPARGFALGYRLDEAWRGRGRATEAGRALLSYAFGSLQARRVEIRCDSNNHASARVARRLGFELRGNSRGKGNSARHQLWVLRAESFVPRGYLPGAAAGAPPMPPPCAGAPPTY